MRRRRSSPSRLRVTSSSVVLVPPPNSSSSPSPSSFLLLSRLPSFLSFSLLFIFFSLGVDYQRETVFFTFNGVTSCTFSSSSFSSFQSSFLLLAVKSFRNLDWVNDFIPVVSIAGGGVTVSLNSGAAPFCFDPLAFVERRNQKTDAPRTLKTFEKTCTSLSTGFFICVSDVSLFRSG